MITCSTSYLKLKDETQHKYSAQPPPEEHCQDGQQTLDDDEDKDDDAVAVGPGVRFRAGCDQSKEAKEENNCTWW